MDNTRGGIFPRWLIFVRERFPPGTHLLMVTVFFFGNAAVAKTMGEVSFDPIKTICAFTATLLIFFRLRVFDEIKDYETDQAVHPDRPLSRGLITAKEAKWAAAMTALAEMAMAFVSGLPALAAWMAVFFFSLLMYHEFFAGSWLRPRMELYALAHTLVSGWLGLFVSSALTGKHLWMLPVGVWGFALVNWAVFNVFEFARKTRSVDEEELGVDSYSRRLGYWGAVCLSMINVLVAAIVYYMIMTDYGMDSWALPGMSVMMLVTAACSMAYAIMPQRKTAVFYRGTMQAFIIGYYLVLAVPILARGL